MYLTDCRTLTADHPDYPIQVRAMARPPEMLYVRGALPRARALAIVGTRRASVPALEFTKRLAAEASRAGWAIWSGGALGIDTAAHEGALLAGGCTVVVMGTGFRHCYPASNRSLFDRILTEGGAWLSPYEPGQSGSRWTFLPRNELLASLADEVVVVQAPSRSGARSTTAAARRMGKRVWAVPAAPWDTNSSGCLDEIAAGATLLAHPAQLTGRRRRPSPGLPDGLTTVERKIAEAVAAQPLNLDSICSKTALSACEVAAATLTLTLREVLVEGADGRYHRAPASR